MDAALYIVITYPTKLLVKARSDTQRGELLADFGLAIDLTQLRGLEPLSALRLLLELLDGLEL